MDLPVVGSLPTDLNGAYFRNGPNNALAPTDRYHWFDGDGMVHGIWFEDGRARYRNRWIDTEGRRRELEAGRSLWPGVLGPFTDTLGPPKDTANTDLVAFGGRLCALWYESGLVHALDLQTLETVGIHDAGGQLPRRISAHSKVDPRTGDFVFFAYGDEPPYLQYGLLPANGDPVHLVDVTLPGPRRPHDLGLTENYAILHDFPVFWTRDVFEKTGKRIPLFHPEVETRLGVIGRRGTDADVAWFTFEPCYMLHVVNCWEEGDWVVMVGCRTADATLRPDQRDGKLAAMLAGLKLSANLYEWRMNLATGETQERDLDDLNAEFPVVAPAVVGQRSRLSFPRGDPLRDPRHLRRAGSIRPRGADAALRLRPRGCSAARRPSPRGPAPPPKTMAT